MRILGIDPGLATVGLGLVDADSRGTCAVIDWLTIETEPGPLPLRLEEIASDLDTYIREHAPDLAVVETLFFQTNRKTAIDVAQARGVIMLTLARANIPFLEPNPTQLKLAITGDGGADKRQMEDMIVRTLKLREIPSPDDAVDALGLALYGAHGARLQHLPAGHGNDAGRDIRRRSVRA